MNQATDSASQAAAVDGSTLRGTAPSAPPKPPKKHLAGVVGAAVKANAPQTTTAASSAPQPAQDGNTQLLQSTLEMARQLRSEADNSLKLSKLKGSEELITRIDEVLVEIDQQSEKVRRAMTLSSSVVQDVKLLNEQLEKIQEFLVTVNHAFMFLGKHKLKLTMQNHYQSLRARCTQLLTAVSLQLLSEKPVETPHNPHVASELYHLAVSYFYGINGKPLNYTYAFEKFVDAAEQGEEHAMVMVAKCYIHGWGTDKHAREGWQWLERAIQGGSASAKTEYAVLVLQSLKERDRHLVKDFAKTWRERVESEGRRSARPQRERETSRRRGGRSQSARHERGRRERSEYDDRESDDPESGREDDEKERESDEDKSEHDEKEYESDARAVMQQDLQRALSLLIQAANAHHVEAKTQLGLFYEEAGDSEQAAKWFSLASREGCSKATVALADLVLYGKGRVSDQQNAYIASVVHSGNPVSSKAKAYSLYTIAAKSGHADAWNGLGLCCESGIGTDVNIDLALAHYREGARLGSAKAMYNLGYLQVKNAMESLESLKNLHAKDLRREEREREREYLEQNALVTVPSAAAANAPYLITAEADSESNHVENSFLVLYASTDEDSLYREMRRKCDATLREGVHWLRCAAENKIDDAAFQLARLYEQGIGVPLDRDAALTNYLFAARYGHAKAACFAANILYERVSVYSHAWDKLIALYRQAALGGVVQAMNSYALLLEDGRGAKNGVRDVYAAAAWYYEACKQKYIKSFLNLSMLLASEDIQHFYTVNGERVTLVQAMQFLEDNLPQKVSSKDAEEFHSLMDVLLQRMGGSQPREKTLLDRKISLTNMSIRHSREVGTLEFPRDPVPRLRESAIIEPSPKPHPSRLSSSPARRGNGYANSRQGSPEPAARQNTPPIYEEEFPSRAHKHLSHSRGGSQEFVSKTRRGIEEHDEYNGIERERREDITRRWRESERDKELPVQIQTSAKHTSWPPKKKESESERVDSKQLWQKFLRSQTQVDLPRQQREVDSFAGVSRSRPCFK